jgi:DNA helicase-2/ATP-dependent DNA helicase PcrA
MRTLPSRFVAEIPSHLTTGSLLPSHTRAARERDGYRRTTTWDAEPVAAQARSRAARPNRYHSGQRVRHAKFGEGIVITSKIRGDDEEVDISFPNYGIKRLSANIANLTTLKDE